MIQNSLTAILLTKKLSIHNKQNKNMASAIIIPRKYSVVPSNTRFSN